MSEEGYPKRTVLKKYAGNDRAGRTAYIDGKPKVLIERPSQWSDSFSINLLFTPESENRIQAIVGRIDTIGRQLGVSFLLAGRDYPIHSAMQAGWYGGDPQDRYDAYDRVYNDAYAKSNNLQGLHLHYKYLLINHDSITLNADDIPSVIKKFRDDVTSIAERESIRPQNMDNILHISLARFTHLPEDETERKEVLAKLKEELIKIRHEISANPINVDVGRVFFGHVMDVARER